MICVNSNCSRVDAVKASANQLKLETAKPETPERETSPQSRKVENRLQSLDDAIKSGDAQKAELALSNVRAAIVNQDATSTPAQPDPDGSGFRLLSAYA